MNISFAFLRFKFDYKNSMFKRAISVLSKKDRRKVSLVVIIQILMGFLDLMGVAVIGVLGALAISGVGSNAPGNRVQAALKLMQIENFSFQSQAAILGIFATVLLVGRTLLSVFFTRRILFFLSRRGAFISTTLVSRLLTKSLLTIQSRSTQDFLYSVTHGVNTVLLGIIGSAVMLISDTSLMIVMSLGLFLVDPVIALFSIIIFGVIGYLLYKLMHVRAKKLGSLGTRLSIQSNEKIVEVLSSYRESMVRNRRSFYAKEIGKLRVELADTQAELGFMPNISKYVIETSVIIGALIISASQFILQDATHAVATLAVFLSAGTRIAPAVLRLQQGAVQIRANIGTAGPTLDLIEELGNPELVEDLNDKLDLTHEGFEPQVLLKNVTFSYPGSAQPALDSVSLYIEPGTVVSIVGPSGAGKTTLIDVLLGVLDADSGIVLISNFPPHKTIAKWPGAISYVPQDVMVANGSIRENVSLGYPTNLATDSLIWNSLKIAHLQNHVENMEFELETQVGERGTRLSGGQRQRIGIARAMFTNPNLLVLDEATSSLDGETEANISDSINNLKGKVTVIMIAHRLSTVRNSDQVIYMDGGRVVSTGTFEAVRQAVPDFDKQAKLMGL